jgi:hypothetical protein
MKASDILSHTAHRSRSPLCTDAPTKDESVFNITNLAFAYVSFLFRSLFDSEDGGEVLLRHIGLYPRYKAINPKDIPFIILLVVVSISMEIFATVSFNL